MKLGVVWFAALLLLAPMGSVAQDTPAPAVRATGPVSADTPQVVSGVKFTVPRDWSERQNGALTVLTPPENDAQLVIVAALKAADAKSAIAQAWRAFAPAFSRKVLLTTSAPLRDGWDEISFVQYVTSPEEHILVQAAAYRSKGTWTVLLASGSQSTFEKREAATSLVFSSLQPTDYVRETFVGRTANRLTPQRVAQLLAFVKTGMKELHVPGVGLALIDHGNVVYDGGLGVRELGKPQLVDKNTLFLIASNTKGLTTLMLARLIDQGKLRWDEPVTEAYPSFRLGSPATTAKIRIEDLVCACTGVPRKDYDWLLGTTPQTGPESTFVQLARTEPTSKYGELFQYSNSMASAAGYIAGHIEYPKLPLGAAYDKAMQTLVFDPLGMSRTTFDMQKALAGDHAAPHGRTLAEITEVETSPVNEVAIPYRPAAEAWSSPDDLLKYVQDEITEGELPNGTRLVSAENLLQRRVHTVPVDQDIWYGMGLEDNRRYGISIIHHGGDMIGYHSDFFAIPSASVGAVILTNSNSGFLLRGPFMRRLLELLYDGKPEAAAQVSIAARNYSKAFTAVRKLYTVPAAAPYASRLASYYTNPALGRLAVRRDQSGLVFGFGLWSSHVGSHKNDDGTISFITIDPGVDGYFEFVLPNDGKRELITRDGQHKYTYTAASP